MSASKLKFACGDASYQLTRTRYLQEYITVGSAIWRRVFKNRSKFTPLEAEKRAITRDFDPLSSKPLKRLPNSGRKSQDSGWFSPLSGTKILNTGLKNDRTMSIIF